MPKPIPAIRQRLFLFFFNDTATTEISPLSLHDALPISLQPQANAADRAIVLRRSYGEREAGPLCQVGTCQSSSAPALSVLADCAVAAVGAAPRRGGLDESEIDDFLEHARQAAPGRACSLLEFLAARVLDLAQGGHDPHPQAITWQLRRSRCLAAG